MVIDNICKEMNCDAYIEWEYHDGSGEYEQPYSCISCTKQGQSYNITDIAKDCPYRDIVQQRLSGSAETASPKSPKGDF
jgi:hypothetical protein